MYIHIYISAVLAQHCTCAWFDVYDIVSINCVLFSITSCAILYLHVQVQGCLKLLVVSVTLHQWRGWLGGVAGGTRWNVC